ncbi:MAG: hypothetical protein ACKOAF_04950 [Actinomycetes bacterium]
METEKSLAGVTFDLTINGVLIEDIGVSSVMALAANLDHEYIAHTVNESLDALATIAT